MKDPEKRSKAAEALRQKAETLTREQATRAPEDSVPLSPEEIRKTRHELRVHQIELEMQNEELRRAQEEIESGRARYFDLYDLAPVGYVTLSEQGMILEANFTAATLLGTTRGLLVRQPLSRFICRDDQDIYYRHRKQLFETGKAQECDLRLVKPDEAFFWAHLTASTAHAEDGSLLYRVVLSDISGRKRSEEALRTSEWFLRSTLDGLSAHIAVLDEQGEIILTNKAYRDFGEHNGVEPGVVSEGANYLTVCDTASGGYSDEAGPFAEGIREVLSGKRLYFELEYPCHSPAEKRWFIGRVTPFTGEGPRRVVVAHEDITGRKQAETEREKLQAQLRQAQKMESVGRLAGGVAHDFNNMLGIIIGHADMVLEQMGPNQPFHEDLVEIRKAGVRSADLTRQLLAFARKQTVAPRVLDLNDTIESMLKLLRRLIGEDINLAWLPGNEVWPVKIDPAQIDQILANLCVNARDAIIGVGKMTIETGNMVFDEAYCKEHAGFVPGDYVTLAVSDNGCGMDSETMSHLFEPFFTTKGLGKGTGLGLATVYGVVKQNNGFINVYSESDQGTSFKIYLPRHLSTTAIVPEKEVDKPAERGFETVLLVEDEPAILRMTTMMLERQGYTVVGAGTPVEAIRLAHEHAGDIHILMSDVVMPEMNGRDLAKNILSIYPHMKCLFMSGYTANVIAHHGVLEEGVNFIQKPFSKSDLSAKVREVLDQE
jgi:PAS domain S-box-containing protein